MAYPYNQIFNFPERILLNKRITKAFFLKNFTLTATEKKLLNNIIKNITWIASIKPSNANIPVVVNDQYKYEEIQIIKCVVPENQLKNSVKTCAEFIQKHIPYQILVVVEDEFEFIINACDKRINQSDTSKRTIEEYFFTPVISKLYVNEVAKSFFSSLDFSNLDKTSLETTYTGYINAIIQYKSALITGVFTQKDRSRTEEDKISIQAIEKLEHDIKVLKNQLKSEKRLNHKVDINISIQNKRREINIFKKNLNK